MAKFIHKISSDQQSIPNSAAAGMTDRVMQQQQLSARKTLESDFENIINVYLRVGGTRELNISHSQRTRAVEQPSVATMCEVAVEVMGTLERQIYSQFLESPEYSEMISVMSKDTLVYGRNVVGELFAVIKERLRARHSAAFETKQGPGAKT